MEPRGGDRTDWPLARGLAALAVGPQPGREVPRSSRRFDWGDSVWRTRFAWDSIASLPFSSMVVDVQHGALTPASRHARHRGAPSKPRIAKSWADVAAATAYLPECFEYDGSRARNAIHQRDLWMRQTERGTRMA
jgi:hypothetical protein